MKHTLLRLLLTVALLPVTGALLPAVRAEVSAPSPAERAIALARVRIDRAPPGAARAEALAALALAQARRARESADDAFYARALASVAEALRQDPDNFAAQRARVWALLGQHEYAQALEGARALNRRVPDDLMTYALLVDACVELGRYDEAETAAQWLLDLRPGSTPALTRAAYLRELFGDVEGALQLMEQALRATRESETEDRAWLFTQISHLHLSLGRVEPAARFADAALHLFPGYHYALAQRAKVETARGEHVQAAATLREQVRAAPHPENHYYLGLALLRAGESAAAARVFEDFEQRARAEAAGWDNANRELIFYYADIAGRPAEALALATREVARRQDVFTLEAQAWALHASGRHAEARTTIDRALAPGVEHAAMLRHAGLIARAQGDTAAAARWLARARTLAPWLEMPGAEVAGP